MEGNLCFGPAGKLVAFIGLRCLHIAIESSGPDSVECSSEVGAKILGDADGSEMQSLTQIGLVFSVLLEATQIHESLNRRYLY